MTCSKTLAEGHVSLLQAKPLLIQRPSASDERRRRCANCFMNPLHGVEDYCVRVRQDVDDAASRGRINNWLHRLTCCSSSSNRLDRGVGLLHDTNIVLPSISLGCSTCFLTGFLYSLMAFHKCWLPNMKWILSGGEKQQMPNINDIFPRSQ